MLRHEWQPVKVPEPRCDELPLAEGESVRHPLPLLEEWLMGRGGAHNAGAAPLVSGAYSDTGTLPPSSLSRDGSEPVTIWSVGNSHQAHGRPEVRCGTPESPTTIKLSHVTIGSSCRSQPGMARIRSGP